jgi:hypothetical protein
MKNEAMTTGLNRQITWTIAFEGGLRRIAKRTLIAPMPPNRGRGFGRIFFCTSRRSFERIAPVKAALVSTEVRYSSAQVSQTCK